MAPPPPDLDRYRADAERFLEAPDAADEGTLDALFSADAVAGLEAIEGGDRRRLRALARFAAEGHLRRAAAAETAEAERWMREPVVGGPGARVAPAEVDALLAAEPDAARRRELQTARLRALDAHVGRPLEEAALRRADAAASLGAPSAGALVARVAGLDLAALAADGEALLAATDDLAARALDRLARDGLGIPSSRLDAADLPRLARTPHREDELPRAAVAAAVDRTREHLGGARGAQPPTALEGAAGAALALRRAGAGLAREGVSPRLPLESRRLGDPALVAAHAALLEGLVADPEWLRRALGAADPEALAATGAAVRLLGVRACAAGPGAGADALSRALGVAWPPELVVPAGLGDLSAADELRGRMLAAALRAHLRETFGARWFLEASAARLLRELWLEGGDLDPDELAREWGQPGLGPGPVAAEVAEMLA